MKHRFYWGRNSLSAAVSLALASTYSAHAQEAPEPDEVDEFEPIVEEVQVTGLRRSLLNSMELKENSSSIVEAISAEEIGKLPDVSIAESLARLPGLAAQRLNGRGQVISVRGLAPDFTTALLNGRPQVSSGDNRGVEFDQYPSELLSEVVVYKTPDASLIGQGLAGTADLRTIRPLKYGKQAIAGNARYERNQTGALNAGSEDDGVRYSFSYVDQFANDTIGVAIGFAHMTNPSQEKRYNAWGYRAASATRFQLVDPNGLPDGERLTNADFNIPDDALVIKGAKPYVRSSELERDGIIGVLEWEPNDKFKAAIDVYASDFSETQLLRGIEFPLGDPKFGDDPDPNYLEPTEWTDGIVTAGIFHNSKGVVRNDVNFRDSELRAIGGNIEYIFNDKWTARIDASYSENDRKDQVLETYAGTGPKLEGQLDTLGFRLNGNEGVLFTSEINYADPNIISLTSPLGWGGDNVEGGQLGYTNNPRTQDQLNNFTISAERFTEDSWVSSIEVGLNFSNRVKSLVADEFYLGLADGSLSAPVQGINGSSNLSFLGIPSMLSYDPLTAFNSGIYALTRNTNEDVVVKSWSVDEHVAIGFAQFNIDTYLGNFPLTGNFGAQLVRTDQESDAFGSQPNPPGFLEGVLTVPLSAGREYTNWLPSLNLTLEVTEGQYLKFAAARSLARPRMDELRASQVVSFNEDAPCADATDLLQSLACDPTDLDDSPWSTSGGNPLLDPWVADAFDLSYELYFADGGGYFAIAAFYKDLRSYIFDQTLAFDFSDFPSGESVPIQNLGRATQPANGTGGSIEGWEVAATINFDAFFPKLEGFGLYFSASFNDSSVIHDPDDPELPLPGLSEEVRNLTLFYERAGFSARVSNRYRSDFLGEVSGFGAGRELYIVEEESVVDAQIGYAWTGDSKYSGLSVFLQGNNLTNEPLRTFHNNDSIQTRDFQDYGKTFLLGASYSY